MTQQTLITPEALLAALAAPASPGRLVLLDCSFDLADTEAGARAYAAGHLPGAHYAHLDRDLSAPKTGRNGRHPLPERATFAARIARWGIEPGVPVVAYDAQGSPYAARAWWLLRWLGHEEVAVLDGGTQAFVAAGGRLSQDAVAEAAGGTPYPDRSALETSVGADALLAALGTPSGADHWQLIDARAPERFRGEVEPLDPVAGHVPGALNRFFKDNLGVGGGFKTAHALHAEFAALAASPDRVVHMCGSGVTACHNLLAMRHAGFVGSRLYPGSWSEWCADPARPVERG